jgi:tetratricopeptide (TPR) repeat protein
LHELGGAHEVRALIAEADFAYQRHMGMHHISSSEAAAVLDRTQAALAALSLPTPASFSQRLAFRRGALLGYSGELKRGLELLDANLAPLQALASTPNEEEGLLASMIYPLIWSGRFEAADATSRALLESRRRGGLANHPYTVFSYVLRAQNLRMAGKFEEAKAALDATPSVPAITGAGNVNPLRFARMVDWERAQVFIDRQDFAAALALLKGKEPMEGELKEDFADYEEMRGVAECSAGHAREGLFRLKQALVNLAKPDDSPNAPWTAHLRGRVGLCALAAGDRTLALESARVARKAFEAQPQVSPYAKAPLYKLERALGQKLPPV